MDKKVMDKISNILLYVGLIGAVIMSVGYIAVLVVLIKGFDQRLQLRQNLIFSGISAVIGFVILTFLKVQGQSWASSIEENKKVLAEYVSPTVKHKKLHSMTYFWVFSSIKDILTKVGTIAISTAGIIYLVVTGSNDWKLLMLGIFNLALFTCLGMLACSKAYNYYCDTYIPYLKERIYESKTKRNLDMVEEKHNKQGDDCLVSASKCDILESSDNRVQSILDMSHEDRDDNSNNLVSTDNTSSSDTSNPSNVNNSLRA